MGIAFYRVGPYQDVTFPSNVNMLQCNVYALTKSCYNVLVNIVPSLTNIIV